MTDRSRRILGAVFGLAMGLAYGLVAYFINHIFLPGVPLYESEPGPVFTLIFTVLAGGAVGLAAAWYDEGISSVLLAALTGAVLSSLSSYIAIRMTTISSERIAGTLAVLAISFFPRAFAFAPVAGLMRWVLGVWEKEILFVGFSVRKMGLSAAALIALALLAGLLALYPQDARYALQTTQDLILEGRKVSHWRELPEPLQKVDGFVENAGVPYTLLLGDDPDVLPIQRPMSSYQVQEYAVFVNFENGFQFGCAFTPPHPQPACSEY